MPSKAEIIHEDCSAPDQLKSEELNIKMDPVSDQIFLQQFLGSSQTAGITEFDSSDVVFVAINTKSKSKSKCGIAMLDSRHLRPGVSERRSMKLITTRYFCAYDDWERSQKTTSCEFAETEFIPKESFQSKIQDCLRIRDSRSSDREALRKIIIVNRTSRNPIFDHFGGEQSFSISRTINFTALAIDMLQVEPKESFRQFLVELKVKHKDEELLNCGNIAEFTLRAFLILAIRCASRDESLSEEGKTKLEILKRFAKRMMTERSSKDPISSIPCLEAGFKDPEEKDEEGDNSDVSKSIIDYRERPKPTKKGGILTIRGNKARAGRQKKSFPRRTSLQPKTARHPSTAANTDKLSNGEKAEILPDSVKDMSGTNTANVTAHTTPRSRSEPQNEGPNTGLSIDSETAVSAAAESTGNILSEGGSCAPADCKIATTETHLAVHKTEITNTDYWNGLREPDESEDEEDGGVSIEERWAPNS